MCVKEYVATMPSTKCASLTRCPHNNAHCYIIASSMDEVKNSTSKRSFLQRMNGEIPYGVALEAVRTQ